MAKVITTELQHAGASSANITLAADGSVTLPIDTVDIATYQLQVQQMQLNFYVEITHGRQLVEVK